MRHRLSVLLVVVVAMTFLCSCSDSDYFKDRFYSEHPTIESQLDYLVNMSGDISVLSKMLGEDSYYLESVRAGKVEASPQLNKKVDEMITYQSEHLGNVSTWMKTRRHYGDKRWYDFFIYFCEIIFWIV